MRTALWTPSIALLALAALPALADDPLASPWKEIAPGVLAAKGADIGADPRWGARVVLVDPTRTRLSVQFDETSPTLAEWRAKFPEALLIANGSFYSLDQTVRPTCDLVSGGKLLHGAGCRVKDALYLGAQAAVAAGPTPRILAASEFLPAEWSEALKSFPPLVRAGVAGCSSTGYCAEASRSAAVGVLRDGRLLFFATQWPAVRREIAQFLAEEMGAVDALNLDGGPEATLALRGETREESIATPATPLPLVLALLPAPPPAAAKPEAAKQATPPPARKKP